MIFYDFEVFRYDWLVVLIDLNARKETVIINSHPFSFCEIGQRFRLISPATGRLSLGAIVGPKPHRLCLKVKVQNRIKHSLCSI